MRSHDEQVLRTTLPDLASDFGPLLAGRLDQEQSTALDQSLRRVREGNSISAFHSAAPQHGRETG